jgi:hypothetical protein
MRLRILGAKVKILLLAGVCANPIMALAEPVPSYNCRNMDFEISCSSEGCVAAEAFTPMDIHLSGEEISLCAYTMCWRGAPDVVQRAGGFVSYTGTGLVGTRDVSDLVDAVITIETASGAASVLVAGRYATPANCTLN